MLLLIITVAACGSVDEDPPGTPDAMRPPDDGALADGPGSGADAASDGAVQLGPWSTPVRIEAVSDPVAAESYPSVTGDGRELYFVSYQDAEYHIWVSRRFAPTDPWPAPQRLVLSAPGIEEVGVEIADDGNTIWFCRETSTNSWDIYTATRTGPDSWTTPQAVAALDTSLAERSPHVTNDGLTMYFSRDDSAGYSDIHVATRGSTSAGWIYRHPVNTVNSDKDEDSMSTTADGLEMYLDSRRDGSWTTYRSTRDPGETAWSVPGPVTELGGGFRPDVAPDGRYLVLVMLGPDGSYDLYESRR